MQDMNVRFHFPIAILVSLLVHAILMALILPRGSFRQREGHGILQIIMQQNNIEPGRGNLIPSDETSLKTARNTEVKHKVASVGAVPMPAAINLPQPIEQEREALERFQRQPSPSYPQMQIMNAMLQAQLAQQRSIRSAAVLAELSNLSTRIRPAISGKIECVQQADNEIECVPAQEEKVYTFLKQFFDLAIEARKLGIAENPVRMDFEPELSVSIRLLH